MGFGSSLLKGIHFGKRRKSRKTKVVESSSITTTYVCRDELDKKKPKIKKQVKFDLEPKYYPSKEEEISHEEGDKKNSTFEKNTVTQEGANFSHHDGVIKVKILMKKEDAARLLIKYRNGGELEFMDVAQQLVQVPSSSVRVLSSPSQ